MLRQFTYICKKNVIFTFKARTCLRGVRLRAVWEILIFENPKLVDFKQANTARSRIFHEYLRENEFLSKTIFVCLSGAQMGSIHEIKNIRQSRDTAP